MAPRHLSATPGLRWPPHPDEADLKLVCTQDGVLLRADCTQVYGYVTNAARWHEWHPATRWIEGAADRPLLQGDTVVEHIRAGGRRFSALWTVLAMDAPHLWVIATNTARGMARIIYRLQPQRLSTGQMGTRFERTLECRSHGALWYRLDPLMMRWVLKPQSKRALAQLQVRLEELTE